MTDIRQALEKAFGLIHPAPCDPRYPDDDEDFAWCKLLERFIRFLDAEAWTDAAMLLVPEGWGWNVSQPNAKAIASGLLKEHTPVRGEVGNGSEQRFIVAGETPAHALLAACLKAKEQADG